MTIEFKRLIKQAESEISAILAKLERDTGAVVESISVRDIEVTTVGDSRREIVRKVVVETCRPPGTNWS
jgi:hypothetical protein